MDRFIDFLEGVNHHVQNYLKSNMDRFIVTLEELLPAD